ncbi:MAG: tyrosine-type recombinase/integrase [Solirubrobacteraceae bacterium]|nr:tyrosine-type recombinase/integrase [Solirubrobacteraceae bacterium]
MRFDQAIDEFLRDKRDAGQINSDRTEVSYRGRLEWHAEDVGNRDPRYTSREDVKRTLRRWEHPNTQANARAILVSFYRWAVEEGLRKDNPAEQTRRPKKRKPSVYRLKRDEVVAVMRAAETVRERRVIYLGLLVGARNQELRGLQRRHFTKQAGAVWISPDIAKGGRERYVPVLPELEPVVEEILHAVGPGWCDRNGVHRGPYVNCAQRSRGGLQQTLMRDLTEAPASPQAIYYIVGRVAKRARIGAHIHPHLLRHAFGDHVTRQAGIRAAQAVLGHASIDTTQSTYTGGVTLDELTAALAFFRYDPNARPLDPTEQTFYPPANYPEIPVEAPSGIEPE